MRAPLLSLMVVLAGCVAPAAPPPAPSPGPGAAVPASFFAPVVAGQGGGVETSIAVHGREVLVCENGLGLGDVLLASLDDGATWRPAAPARAPEADGDCDVAIGGDGTWYAAFLDTAGTALPMGGSIALPGESVVVAASRDHGATWSLARVPGAQDALTDRPWLRAVGDRSVVLTHKAANVAPLTVWFQRSDDGGATWSPPVLVASADDPAHPNGNVGKMAVSSDGRTIHVPLHRFDTQQGAGRDEWLDVAESTDGGATWVTKHAAGPVKTRVDDFLPSMGRANGTLYVAMPLANGSQAADLTLLASHDDGATWSRPILLARGQDMSACQSEAALALDPGPDGAMDAAWFHWAQGWVTSVARVQRERVAFVRDVTAPAGHASYIEFLDLAHDAQGRMRIAYPVPQRDTCDVSGADVAYLAGR